MPLAALKKLSATAPKKGSVTYSQVLGKRKAEEACLKEAQAAKRARSLSLMSDRSEMGAPDRQLTELYAQMEAQEREIAELFAEDKLERAVVRRNTDAWIHNVRLTKATDALEPMVDDEGKAIEGFPETIISVLLLDDAALSSLLVKFGLVSATGSRAQKVWRFTNHVGIGCWLRDFFEHRLGEKHRPFALSDLDIDLEKAEGMLGQPFDRAWYQASQIDEYGCGEGEERDDGQPESSGQGVKGVDGSEGGEDDGEKGGEAEEKTEEEEEESDDGGCRCCKGFKDPLAGLAGSFYDQRAPRP